MKPELEYFATESFGEWVQVEGAAPGVVEKILSLDPESGDKTRLLRFPVTEQHPQHRLVHDFWEETIILEGSIHDVTSGDTFEVGFYACRPPGMLHGPYTSQTGCLTFEMHYRK